jgi:hypothetical protein
MNAVSASSTAMTAVSASSTAMTAVSASSTAADAINASQTASTAVFNSNNAGLFLNGLRVRGGLASDATLAGLTTMTAVSASSTAMNAVSASSTAMTAIWASNTASDAVLTSATARSAVHSNDIALAALQANPAQVQRQLDTPGRTATTSTASLGFTYVANGTRAILLRCFMSGNEDLSLAWRRGNTVAIPAGAADGILLPNGDNLGVNTAAIGRTTTYANSGTSPTADNANANVVSAANGLRRITNSITGNLTQTVRYILV